MMCHTSAHFNKLGHKVGLKAEKHREALFQALMVALLKRTSKVGAILLLPQIEGVWPDTLTARSLGDFMAQIWHI